MWRKRTFSELSAETFNRKGKLPLVLVLHNIRSQYNVGAILRTADAAGVEKVIISGYTPKPEQSGVKKTALRGLEGINWVMSETIIDELQSLKKQGYVIYGLEQCHGGVAYHKQIYDFPAVLIVGEEVSGIEDELLTLCDHVIEIPMFGKAHSLNVSVATGVILYHLLQQFGR
ncbi:MAG: TrmH family RNA methyltransferase [Candidatus Abawacabacteria bacterium]|nr:TrmH family RNA methyltransferase [Candidatus Abawacabacteria bacterium]